MKLFLLEGKNILVTGASSGIGKATAILCAELGARVILLGRHSASLQDTLTLMRAGNHSIVQFDLLELNNIQEMMRTLAVTNGLLDGLAHCAGLHMIKPLRMITAENIDDIVRANVTTGILLTKAFRNKLISKRPASIVFLASVAATVGQAAVSPYALSKGALVAAMKSLAVELVVDNIRINAVLPGVVNTPMTQRSFEKMGKDQISAIKKAHLLGLGEPEDIAYSIAFLLSPAARWITGSCLMVDGGYTTI